MARFMCFLLLFFFIHQSDAHMFYRTFINLHRFQFVPPNSNTFVRSHWIEQPLDHFTSSDERYWSQRYFMNDTYYDRESNVVFLLINGPSEASPVWIVDGQWLDYAQQFKALCFQIEHRFYGYSVPTRDLKRKSLKYLTSHQTLADYAAFIDYINKKYEFGPSVKWVLFGHSYGGSLAAWMKLKYPHLVFAAIATGAPVLAQVNFKNFYISVAETLKTYGNEGCSDEIDKLNEQISTLMTTIAGRDLLTRRFRLCDSFDRASEKDISTFFSMLASYYGISVQFDQVNFTFSNTSQISSLDNICKLTANYNGGDHITRLGMVNAKILETAGLKCLDYKYSTLIEILRDHSWLSAAARGVRQWLYQSCNEFGLFLTTDDDKSLFPQTITAKYYIDMCTDVFGYMFHKEQLYRAVNATNLFYGGVQLNADKIIYVQGSLDPWRSSFVNESVVKLSPSIHINGTAHCANVYPELESDVETLKLTRKIIGGMLESFIHG